MALRSALVSVTKSVTEALPGSSSRSKKRLLVWPVSSTIWATSRA